MSKRPNNGILKLWRQKWRLLLFFSKHIEAHRKDRKDRKDRGDRGKKIEKNPEIILLDFEAAIRVLDRNT